MGPPQSGGWPSSLIPVALASTPREWSLCPVGCLVTPTPAQHPRASMDSGAQLPPPPQPHQLCTSLKDVPLVAKLMFVLSALNYAYFPPSLALSQGREGEQKKENDFLSLHLQSAHFCVIGTSGSRALKACLRWSNCPMSILAWRLAFGFSWISVGRGTEGALA